jgi:V/A-type H+/Na+-transporting ATPase subunit I
MAVQSMKFVSMVGPVDAFDPFVLKYLLNSSLQLERSYNALQLGGLVPYNVENRYEPLLKRMKGLNEHMGARVESYTREQIVERVLSPFDLNAVPGWLSAIEDQLRGHRKNRERLMQEIQDREQTIRQVRPLAAVSFNVDDMFHVSFFKFRFGRMSRETYHKQQQNFESMDVIVIPTKEEGDDIWLSYFTPAVLGPKIDSVFGALGFARVHIPEAVHGTSTDTIARLESEIKAMQLEMEAQDAALAAWLEKERPAFALMMNRLAYLSKTVEIKNQCAHTRDVFHLVGWMPVDAYLRLIEAVDPMEGVVIDCEDPRHIHFSTPPTILRNAWFFKPFESIVRMYGLPSHNELDPTKFVTFTFIFMFGFMFGDVGQGLLFALLGAFLFFAKKSMLGGVVMYAGLSSTVFGFLYGSVFGNEEILHAAWLSPIATADNINTLMFVGIGYGAFIVLVSMGFSMVNAIRTRHWGRLLFDRNGLAGLVFYGGILGVVLHALATGNLRLSVLVIVLIVVLPLVLMLLKEPLERLMERKRPAFPTTKGMYFTEAGFELFETVLGFLSNTISFIRISAFAMNHAGFSLAVWTLYHMMEGSAGGVLTLVIGNLLIMVLEGMIVGIQCLRLEFYEAFGRFYEGEGHPFKPLAIVEDPVPERVPAKS